MQCPQCGTINPDDARFCKKCGRNLAEEYVSPPGSPVPPSSPAPPPYATGSVGTPAPRRFYRCTNDKVIGGVCSGIAHYMGVDVFLIRVLTALGLLVSGGSALLAYLIVWIITDEAPCLEPGVQPA